MFLTFKDLRPELDLFVFNDGRSQTLLQLDGTIPVSYKGLIYNIPICMWLMDDHPYIPPKVFVKPTSNMAIKSGRNVDMNGKVDLPYLKEWRYPNSDLVGLVQILCIVFGEDPPVYSKVQKSPQPTAAQNNRPSNATSTGSDVCKVCLDGPTCTVFMDCRHFVCCESCAVKLDKCPICVQAVTSWIRVYKA